MAAVEQRPRRKLLRWDRSPRRRSLNLESEGKIGGGRLSEGFVCWTSGLEWSLIVGIYQYRAPDFPHLTTSHVISQRGGKCMPCAWRSCCRRLVRGNEDSSTPWRSSSSCVKKALVMVQSGDGRRAGRGKHAPWQIAADVRRWVLACMDLPSDSMSEGGRS